MDWREDLILNFVDRYSENREERGGTKCWSGQGIDICLL